MFTVPLLLPQVALTVVVAKAVGPLEVPTVLGPAVRDNITLASLGRYMKGGFVQPAREARSVDALIKELSIKTPHRDQPVRNLSGGNQQKVTLAKCLSCQSRVYVLDEPTVAVDVGAKVEIYQWIQKLAARGIAILLASSEMPELIGLCHRVLVLREGAVSAEIGSGEATQEAIMRAASL